jgi:hypothetical protein
LIWAARHTNFIHTVLDRELRDAITHPSISLMLYSTSPSSVSTKVLDLSDAKTPGSVMSHGVEVRHGRPDIPSLIPDVIFNTPGGDKAAVICCVPPQMSDMTRRALTGVMKDASKGCVVKDMQYFEERFDW